MTELVVGFVGAGRVTRILLTGWARAGGLPARILVSDPDPAAVARVAALVPVVQAVDLPEAAGADLVIVAVPPPAVTDTIASLHVSLAPGSVVLSLAPGTSLAGIARVLGGDRQVVRLIPNAASIVGAGYNPVAFGPSVTPGTREILLALLAPLGKTPEVPDEQLEAYAVLTAMGPNYLWPQLFALLDVADRTGLDDEAAMTALQAMVHGALATMADPSLSRDQVNDLIPARPLAGPVATMAAAYTEVLPPLHARLTGTAVTAS